MKKRKSILLTFFLSFIPGLAQIYLGEKRKGFTLLIIDGGIFLTLILSKSYLIRLLMSGIYLAAFLPSAIESHQMAKGSKRKLDTNSRWYVTMLILFTGFSALPLLWNSARFSKRAKIAWTIAVPVLAFLFFGFLIKYWDRLEDVLRKTLNG